jgi:uncharacterized tellurite resistance protein B-like protein
VVAEPLKFKLKLRIGEDAYAILRLKKGVQSLWDVGGVASTGATVAASKLVATTLFASSGGLLSAFGIGTAATPIGWVIAAAMATGGLYFGVTRLVQGKQSAFVDTVPRFINTPIDLLGMQLFDLVGTLALRVAQIDGVIAPEERETIRRCFVDEWGYDPAYVAAALPILEETAAETRVKAIAGALAQFQAASPDCNGEAMQKELLDFLRAVIEADGLLDEREELAIDAIAEVFRKERALTMAKVGKAATSLGDQAGKGAAAIGGKAGAAAIKLGEGAGKAAVAVGGQAGKLASGVAGSTISVAGSLGARLKPKRPSGERS